MSSTLSWQLPSLDPHLAARRYLLRRRDCLAPIRTAAFQHPDLGPMIRALLAFATDGILLAEERRTARPLVHLAFDEAWQLYTPQREHDDAHGPMWPRPILPLETYLVILPVAYLAREMAGLRLRCGEAFWSPQTGAPLQDWLRRQHGEVVLHAEPLTLEAQQRLRWRLYNHAVPERLRHLLDSRLTEVLRIRDCADEIAAG